MMRLMIGLSCVKYLLTSNNCGAEWKNERTALDTSVAWSRGGAVAAGGGGESL